MKKRRENGRNGEIKVEIGKVNRETEKQKKREQRKDKKTETIKTRNTEREKRRKPKS